MMLDPSERLALELLYRQLLSVVVLLARVLGKPCPVQDRAERRQNREEAVQ